MVSHAHTPLWRIYGFAVVVSLIIALIVGLNLGAASLLTVLILAGIEISFSFENAIINAKILQRMSEFWQKMFMTVGIIIAVFLIRFLLPIVMVSAAAKLSLSSTLDLALNHPELYSVHLHGAHAVIAAFGSMFLLMIFLDFIFEDRHIKWLVPLEERLAKLGKLESLSVIVAMSLLILAMIFLTDQPQKVFLAGSLGVFIYLIINTLESAQQISDDAKAKATKSLLKAGFIGFLYLELIDASFSLDGVIGAFAITTDIILITAGLAIGALFVRAMTIHILHKGTLQKYIYLDHGAHYAIGLLALLLLVSLRWDLPEWLTGLSGICIISIALLDSYYESKQQKFAKS